MRPCHGNATPENLVQSDGRLYLVNWWNASQADAAFEVAYAAGLATLQSEITTDQYRRFLSDYLSGMQDSGDSTLDERLRIVATVLPFWFACRLLETLSLRKSADRAYLVRLLVRSLEWLQGSLGVEVANPADVTAPLLALPA